MGTFPRHPQVFGFLRVASQSHAAERGQPILRSQRVDGWMKIFIENSGANGDIYSHLWNLVHCCGIGVLCAGQVFVLV